MWLGVSDNNKPKGNKMNAKTQAAVMNHGRNLLAIFPGAIERDPAKLCKRLRKLEREAAAIGLRLCNGPQYEEGEADKLCAIVLGKVNALLGNSAEVPVFVNRDPRGYALKIEDGWMYHNTAGRNPMRLHMDWGGYGIIAPDLTV